MSVSLIAELSPVYCCIVYCCNKKADDVFFSMHKLVPQMTKLQAVKLTTTGERLAPNLILDANLYLPADTQHEICSNFPEDFQAASSGFPD